MGAPKSVIAASAFSTEWQVKKGYRIAPITRGVNPDQEIPQDYSPRTGG